MQNYIDVDKLVISSDIPIPTIRVGGVKNKWHAVLLKLNVGDSFVIPTKNRSTIYSAAKVLELKFYTRAINETESRIWRAK